MTEPVVSIDVIKRAAHDAAERGESLNDACPWPFDTEAGRSFKHLFFMHKAALQALLRPAQPGEPHA